MPSFRERMSAAYRGFRDPGLSEVRGILRLSPVMPSAPRERYALLRMQKENTVYRDLKNFVQGIAPHDYERIRALENPALQAVEFHVMHVFPGSLTEALPLDLPADEPLRLAAERVMAWSWFGRQKDRLVDVATTYGDGFVMSWSTDTRVGIQVRLPEDVTDFKEDAEGNIIYVRFDVELEPENPGDRPTYLTEVWSREDDLYEAWRHERGFEADIDELPRSDVAIASGEYTVARITSFDYDFVPLTRASFSSSVAPSERGPGVFEPHREAIDELLRNGTILRDRYFRHGKPLWQSVTSLEKPVDYIEQMARDANEDEQTEVEEARMPDNEPFVRNPKGTRLEALVPAIDYSAGLAQIEDSRMALERSMAELRFFRGHDTGDPSGAAMDKHQAPALRRARAARGNFEEAILKALKMCLTMGQSRGLFAGIPDFGSYAAGDFDALSFTPRPVVPETEAELMAQATQRAEMYAALKDVSPELLRLRLVEDGFEEADAQRISSVSTTPTSIAELIGGGFTG